MSTATVCRAQDWFEIELIIFEYLDSRDEIADSDQLESWPSDLDLSWPSPLLELEAAVERTAPAEITPPFEELPFEQRRMNNDSYALRVRDSYELLWHKAWKAPLLPEQQAPWILVEAGQQLGDHYRLEGAIRIHLSRYLHLSTNLWLTEVRGEPIIEEIIYTPSALEQAAPAPLSVENPELANPVLDTDRTAADNRYPLEDSPAAINDLAASDTELTLLDSVIEEVEAQSEFDWSQLPEPISVRWGCNYVRELWPQADRILPDDFYQNPAPKDWYHPFGCHIPSDIEGLELPISVSMAPSSVLDAIELEQTEPGTTAGSSFIRTQAEPDQPESILLAESEPPFTELTFDEPALDTLAMNRPSEADEMMLVPPQQSVHYLIDEIVHIQSERRMRSAEYHYVDHPRIGIIAIIHPLEKPELILQSDLDSETTAIQEPLANP